jgi:hypothetical protein
VLRIQIVQVPPVACIDGIQLSRFTVGHCYEVGNSLGAVFLAEGWAEPVALDEPSPPPYFSEEDTFKRHSPVDPDAPANLIREVYPPYYDHLPSAAAGDLSRPPRRRR